MKRKGFKHEKEERAVVQEIPPSQGDLPDLSNAVYDVGKYCEVDVASMIKEVVVAPCAEDWYVELVGSVSELYGLEAPVRRPRLSADPVFDHRDLTRRSAGGRVSRGEKPSARVATRGLSKPIP